MIEDVIFKDLNTFNDERGFFREVIRSTDVFFNCEFGQWSHSFIFDGVIKAWHYHNKQTDFFYICSGVARIGLYDLRPESQTYKKSMDFYMGDLQQARVVKIPPNIAHGIKVIQGPVNLLYLTSHIYNPDDEIRIAYDDPEIDFDWLRGAPIK